MERLLTPLVVRLLSRFVKGAGKTGSDVRASLSGGGVVLHNLELDLTSLFEGVPVAVDRAFASRLTVAIPWTSLGSQPIQVHLDTVEVILSLREVPQYDGDSKEGAGVLSGPPSHGHSEAAEPLLGGGWMGTLTNLLLRTLLDVSVTVSNTVVKLCTPHESAILTSQHMQLSTAAGDWKAGLQEPRKWLKKTLHVANVLLSLESNLHQAPAIDLQVPLLCLNEAEVSALFPVFAVLERQTEGAYEGSIDLKLAPLMVSLTQSRLLRLRGFVLGLIAALSVPEGQASNSLAVSKATLCLPDEARSLSMFSARRGKRLQAEVRRSLYGERASSGFSSAASGAMGTVSAVWSFISAEAATEGSLAPEDAALLPPPPKLDISVCLSVLSEGAALMLYHDTDVRSNTPTEHTNEMGSSEDAQAWWQALHADHTVPRGGAADPANVGSPRKSRFLQDFEEAAASLPVSPSASAAVSPFHSPAVLRASKHPAAALPAPLLAVNWVSLGLTARAAHDKLLQLSFTLARCAVQRTVPSPAQGVMNFPDHVLDEVLGLYPVDSVESPALTQQDGTLLAMRMHWQAGSEGETAPGQKVAVHVGQLFVCYAPGLLSQLAAYFSPASSSQDPKKTASVAARAHDHPEANTPPSMPVSSMSRVQTPAAGSAPTNSTEASLGHDEAKAPSQRDETMAPPSQSRMLPPSWLTGGIALSASVLSLQLGALSSPGTQAAAFLVVVERCSMHLGPYKPSARPGSLLGKLFSLHKQAPPGAGLRMALSGIRPCAATRWLPAASRAGDAEAVLRAAGAEAVSDPIDLLALVTPAAAALAADSGSGSPKDPDGWVLSAALSPVSMQLSGMQLAAASAAAQALQAEIWAGFSGPLQERMWTQHVQVDAQPATWLTGAAVIVRGLWLMHSPAGASQHAADPGRQHSDSQPGSICHAESIAVNVQSSVAHAGVSVTVRDPALAAGPDLQLRIPVVELSVEGLPSPPAAVQSGQCSQAGDYQPPSSGKGGEPAPADKLPLLYIHNIQTHLSSISSPGDRDGLRISTTLESASFGMCLSQLAALATFCRTAGSLPALPELACPAAAMPAKAPTQPSRMSLSCGSIVGQISTEHITATELAERHGVARGVALCIHDAAVTAASAVSQAVTQQVTISVGSYEVSTLCQRDEHNLASFWLLRSLKKPLQIVQNEETASLTLQLSKKVPRGTQHVHQDISLSVQDIAARLCPAAMQQLHTLMMDADTDSHPAGPPGMSTTPLGVDISSATSSIRCSVRRASIDVMSALQEEHVHSTMHAASSSSTPLSSSVRVCAEDIALVHHSQGQQPQSLSHRDRAALTSTKQYDASALSTTVTLFGPGLPFRGAPLLLPVDLNIALDTAGQAVQASIAGPTLYTQLSPACIEGLQILAQSYRTASRGETRAEGSYEATGPADRRNATTVTICSQHLRFDLCLDRSPAAASNHRGEEQSTLLDPIASISVSELQASCNSLSSTLRVTLSGTVQGSFLDDSTSCFELLLEPSAMEIVLHSATAPARDGMFEEGRDDQTSELTTERLATPASQAASSAPARPGLTLLLRAPEGHLGIRLSVWRLQALRRLLARLLASQKLPDHTASKDAAASAPSASGVSGSDVQACNAAQTCGDGPAAVIMVQNLCSMDLLFGQVGTDECIAVADGTSVPYRWHAHPGLTPSARRLLRLKGTGRASITSLPSRLQQNLDPAGSDTGVGPSEKQDLQWSEAFDAMCSAAHLALVEVASGMQAHMAVSTSQVGASWHVTVRKGHRVVNRAGQALHVRKSHTARGSPAECSDVMLLKAQEASAQEMLVCSTAHDAAGLDSTCARVWLGAGWSQALYLSNCKPQAGELEVVDSRAPLPATGGPLGMLCFQIRPPHENTGQVDVVLWPRLAIRNELPFPVEFSVDQDPELTGSIDSQASTALALASQSEPPPRLRLRQKGGQEHPTRWSEGLSHTKGLGRSNSILPPLNHHAEIDLPTDNEGLAILLCAVSFEKEGPTLCYTLRAQLLVRNTTEQPYELHFAAGKQIAAKPMTVMAANWRPLLERPDLVSVVLVTSCPGRSQGESGRAAYHSEPFSTEPGACQLLTLRPAIAGDPSFRLVSVQVQLGSSLDSTSVGAETGPCETCTIVISPGVYLSNLSSSELYAAHGSPIVPADPVCVPGGQSQPLPWTWQKSQGSGPLIALGLSRQDCAQAVASLQGSTGMTRSDVTAAAGGKSQPHGGALTTARPEAEHLRGKAAVPSLAESFVSFLESQAGRKSSKAAEMCHQARPPAIRAAVIDIKQHQRSRTPIVLQGSDGKEVSLAVRVLTTSGRIHIVAFHDPQPAVLLDHSSSQDMEVCLESSEQRSDGAVTFTAIGQITKVPAHSGAALSPGSSHALRGEEGSLEGAEQQGGWRNDAEEEEAFLEAVTRQQPSQCDLLLKCRWAGASDWACWHVLREGASCTTGGMLLVTSRQGPSLHVHVRRALDSPVLGGVASTAVHGEAAGPPQSAMQLEVMCKCLRVSFWDDERRIILGPPMSGAPGTASEQEAVCLYIDGLTASATFPQPHGSTLPGALAISVKAEALQCDSHLPGKSAVILHSQSGVQAGRPGAHLQAPLLLQLEMSMAGGGSIKGSDLRYCWVNLLSSNIPVLVLAVDDALLTSAERVFQNLRMSGDTQRPAEQNASGSSQADQQAQHALFVKAEAQTASAPRLLVQSLNIAPLHLLVDVHAAGGSRHIPITVDTHRAPVTLAGLQGRQLLFRPGVMLQATAAHFTAEALMNIPRMLGSLELLLNPTGLLTSVSAGLEDLLGLPFAALVEASPAQFVASLGRGPASLLWHVSGWTLTSVSGFSAAASRVIQRNLSARQASMRESEVVATPGVMSSLRRRAVSAVTLPFDLVSGVTAGIASSTGILRKATPRHPARTPGPRDTQASAEMCMRMVHAAGLPCGSYIFHYAASEATLYGETHGELPSVTAVHMPVLLLTSQALLVLSGGGTRVATSISLAGASLSSNHLRSQLWLEGGMRDADGSSLKLHASVPSGMWHVLVPLLREHLTLIQQ